VEGIEHGVALAQLTGQSKRLLLELIGQLVQINCSKGLSKIDFWGSVIGAT